jgi:hypothetical protein
MAPFAEFPFHVASAESSASRREFLWTVGGGFGGLAIAGLLRVVLPDHRGFASNGPKNWDTAFLPAQHQGTIIYPGKTTPIADLFPGKGGGYVTQAGELATRKLLRRLNREHAEGRPGDSRLEARIRSYELAAKMQLAAPKALDVAGEPKHILKLYGLDHGQSSFPVEINATEEIEYFGRQNLGHPKSKFLKRSSKIGSQDSASATG